jgi:hypothetical protein
MLCGQIGRLVAIEYRRCDGWRQECDSAPKVHPSRVKRNTLIRLDNMEKEGGTIGADDDPPETMNFLGKSCI